MADPEADMGGGSRGPKGRVGEGTGVVSPPVGGGSGASPEIILKKKKQNGAIWSANQAFQTHSNLAVSLVKSGADPEPPLPGGGALVTNEAEGFTEARSAERGRVGEGVTPSRWWGSGGSPLGNLHQNGAF